MGGSGNNFSENASLRGQEYAVEVRVDLYQDVSICEDTLLGFLGRLLSTGDTLVASSGSRERRVRRLKRVEGFRAYRYVYL